MNEMAANKLQEASEHLQSMGRVLLEELKEDLQKFIDCKLKQVSDQYLTSVLLDHSSVKARTDLHFVWLCLLFFFRRRSQ